MARNLSENKICFIANYNKTYLFDAVASNLVAHGMDVCWIVVNQKLRDFLVAQYGSHAVLYLSKDDVTHAREPVGNFRLNELVYGDRTLRHQIRWAYSFLNNIQQPVYEFLKRHGVKFVFGEITWAHEILIHRLVNARQELMAIYYCPHTVRMPNGRFGFFSDEYQSALARIPAPPEEQSVEIPPSIQVKKPDYLRLNDQKLQKARTVKARLARLKRYFTMENIDPADPTLIVNRWLSLKISATEEINRELYRLVPKVNFDESLASRDYVFLGLHKQPEASIDVIGRYYEDQYTNIVNIWRALPDDWWLLVKEHSNAVGDRAWPFYHKIRRLRNVVLVDEAADSHDIIRRARAVVTVSGTIAYEAALMGKPSLTFADVFFNRLAGCQKISIDDLRSNSIADLIQPIDDNAITLFSNWILEHSAEGIISDPISNPTSMSPENIQRVSKAFARVIGMC